MTVFVRIHYLNGRSELMDLAQKLERKGFDDRVEYNGGGWVDDQLCTIAPHLKFEDEDDALAYVLAYGGQVSKELPVRET